LESELWKSWYALKAKTAYLKVAFTSPPTIALNWLAENGSARAEDCGWGATLWKGKISHETAKT
jgi:hypothetical protein